jgi:hypothetical protein
VGKWVFVRFVLYRSVVLLWVEVLEVVYLNLSYGTTAHIKLCPPLYWCFLITPVRHTVGLLWTSDQRVAETSTYTGQHNRQISMPRARFEPAIPATKRLQTYALDRAATGIGILFDWIFYFFPIQVSSFWLIFSSKRVYIFVFHSFAFYKCISGKYLRNCFVRYERFYSFRVQIICYCSVLRFAAGAFIL